MSLPGGGYRRRIPPFMDERIVTLEKPPAPEASQGPVFAVLCAVVVLLALGFMMYRIAKEPRQLAGDMPEHRVAPPGTFFAREYVAIPTPKGVIGLPPGTAVFVRQKGNGPWVVNDGIDDLAVSASSLTVDADLAANLRAHDAEAQSRAAASQARAEQLFQKSEMARRLRDQAEMDAAAHRIAGQPVGGTTPLDHPTQARPGGAASYYANPMGGGTQTGPSYYDYQTQRWVTVGR